jgi:hypothetical protein
MAAWRAVSAVELKANGREGTVGGARGHPRQRSSSKRSGYSSAGMVHLLRDLKLPVAARCDLDAHGIQIIHVLEGKLSPPIHPLGIDVDLWEKPPSEVDLVAWYRSRECRRWLCALQGLGEYVDNAWHAGQR